MHGDVVWRATAAPMAARIGARSPDMRPGERHNSTATMMRSLPPISAANTAFDPCRRRSSAMLVNGRLDVFGVQLAAGDDHQVLDAAGHRELAVDS